MIRWTIKVNDCPMASGPADPNDPRDVAHVNGIACSYRQINPEALIEIDWTSS
jgi:hypothetical protein